MSEYKTERFVKKVDGHRFTVSVTKTYDGWLVVHTHVSPISQGSASTSSSAYVPDPSHLMETDDFVTADFKAEGRGG